MTVFLLVRTEYFPSQPVLSFYFFRTGTGNCRPHRAVRQQLTERAVVSWDSQDAESRQVAGADTGAGDDRLVPDDVPEYQPRAVDRLTFFFDPS